jgi:6-phosphofructokinase 1
MKLYAGTCGFVKRIGVLTSGGDAPGMNVALRAVVRTAVYHGIEVMGIERGYTGLVTGRVRPFGARDVSGIIKHGGTVLKSARCEEFLTPEGRSRAAETINEFKIDALVLIGGDGTYRGAEKLHEEHGVPVVGVPGTIDNDIGGTDYTIGFDTAVNTAMDAIDRIRDTAESHDRLFCIEVMGRHAGFLALEVGLAGGAEIILLPEVATPIEDVCARLETGRQVGKLSSIVVVAEGSASGDIYTVKDAILANTGFTDIRLTVLGHMQRGGSPTAFERAWASRMGHEAVTALMRGESCVQVALYDGELMTRPISDAWNIKRTIDQTDVELVDKLAT